MKKIRRALISVSDKKGLEELGKTLQGLGIEILSTGGTARELSGRGIPVREVSQFTGFPEMLDGRVKTLHPKVHGGILARRANKEHARAVKNYGLEYIDMVVVNLYPFETAAAKPDVSEEELLENIDIGGPTMIRAAAKNFEDVAVVVSPDDDSTLIRELPANQRSLPRYTLFRRPRPALRRGEPPHRPGTRAGPAHRHRHRGRERRPDLHEPLCPRPGYRAPHRATARLRARHRRPPPGVPHRRRR